MAGNLVISTINSKDISSSPVATESQVIGVGQTWQDVTASRASGVTYTNSTGKPIMVAITGHHTSGNASITIIISGVTIRTSGINNGLQAQDTYASFLVPIGGSYSASLSVATLFQWSELR